MSDYNTRFQNALLGHISDTVEQKGEHLVINRQMANDDVHWHRGYIAAYRDIAVFIKNDLRKKVNEE